MVGAEARIVSKGTKAAAQLLSTLQSQGKTGASMPVVIDTFFEGIGGQAAFGKLMTEDFRKVRGEGLSPEELEHFKPSPKLVLQWYELISRHAGKVDENKSLDVSSLDEAALESILADLGRTQMQSDPSLRRSVLYTAIKEDKEFRRLAFEEAIKEDPSLVDELLRQNGIETLDGSVGKLESGNNVEEAYDPSKDEYDA